MCRWSWSRGDWYLSPHIFKVCPVVLTSPPFPLRVIDSMGTHAKFLGQMEACPLLGGIGQQIVRVEPPEQLAAAHHLAATERF